MTRMLPLFVVVMMAACSGVQTPPAAAPFPSGDVIDLSHTYDETTIFWPTSERFRPDKVSDGMTAGGYYYAANNFFTAEHGGTHLDAPVHFAQGAQTVDQIPLDRFVGTAVIVDVIAQSERHADYRRSSPRTSSAQNVG